MIEKLVLATMLVRHVEGVRYDAGALERIVTRLPRTHSLKALERELFNRFVKEEKRNASQVL